MEGERAARHDGLLDDPLRIETPDNRGAEMAAVRDLAPPRVAEDVAAKTPVDGKVDRQLPLALGPELRDGRGGLTADDQGRVVVDQRGAPQEPGAGLGQLVGDVARVERFPRLVQELVHQVATRTPDVRIDGGRGGGVGGEVAQLPVAQPLHGPQRAFRSLARIAGPGRADLDQQLAQRRLYRPARQAVVAEIDEAAGLEAPADDPANRLPHRRAHPTVDPVQDDEIERRQVPGRERLEGDLVERDVARADGRGVASRLLDVRRVELAGVELPLRKGGGVGDQRGAAGAAELQIREAPIEADRTGAANGGHVVQPGRRQLEEEPVRIGRVRDVPLRPVRAHRDSPD